jgi:hypothetical protein
MAQLGDFMFVAMEIKNARHVAGFGTARSRTGTGAALIRRLLPKGTVPEAVLGTHRLAELLEWPQLNSFDE